MIKASIENFYNVVDLLKYRAENQREQIAYRFLKDGETQSATMTYQELDLQATAIAVYLNSLNLSGSRALIIYPYDKGLEFITTFFGCLYAGVVAVTCHPPMSRHGFHELQSRLNSSQSQAIITDKSSLKKIKEHLIPPAETFHWIAGDDIPSKIASHWSAPNIKSESLAFLQYTSGSTGAPKGVMITHECLMYNQKMLKQAFGHTETAVGVGWLPLFHDMGLIGKVLQALYVGRPSIFMSPIAFIQKPVRWLQAISHYQATTSGGPNFAYDLLCRHVTPQQRENLDLSSWDVAFCGAEPIRVETIDRFYSLFKSCGFRREAFYSCYGMAEASLLITGGLKNAPPVVKYFSEAKLEENIVLIGNEKKPGFRPLVGCGQTWLDGEIAIVDPDSCIRCRENQVGEIWVSGSGLGKGYWNNPELSEQTFRAFIKDTQEGPFLRTGDLGFLSHKELFVTGRLNDVMVFWGINQYPQLIEETVQGCHPALRANSTAAFSTEINGESKLVIVQEVERSYRNSLDFEEVVEVMRWTVFDKHFLDIYAIVLLKPGSIPKTSSGKIQRQLCKAKFLEGTLDPLREWRHESSAQMDMTLVLRRYLNPITHLKRFYAIARAKFRRLFS